MAVTTVDVGSNTFLLELGNHIRKVLGEKSEAMVAEFLKSIEKQLQNEIAKIVSRIAIEMFSETSFERMGPTLRIEVRLPKKEGGN